MAALGHCVEFNVGGGVIQDQRSAKCGNTFPKCDNIYNSFDAYKCNAIKKKHNYVFYVYNILLKDEYYKIIFKLVILNKKE